MVSVCTEWAINYEKYDKVFCFLTTVWQWVSMPSQSLLLDCFSIQWGLSGLCMPFSFRVSFSHIYTYNSDKLTKINNTHVACLFVHKSCLSCRYGEICCDGICVSPVQSGWIPVNLPQSCWQTRSGFESQCTFTSIHVGSNFEVSACWFCERVY